MEDKIYNGGSLVLKPWTISAQPEYWWPVDENEDVMADHYNLTGPYLLPTYMADWIIRTQQVSKNLPPIIFFWPYLPGPKHRGCLSHWACPRGNRRQPALSTELPALSRRERALKTTDINGTSRVADPDVFGPPGSESGSSSTRYKYKSGFAPDPSTIKQKL